MPYDSEGNFTRIHSWEEDRVNDIDIVSDRHDEEDDNFAAGLNDCMLRDGRSAMTGDLKMNNFQIKNLANGTVNSDAVNKKQLDDSKINTETLLKQIINKMWKIGDIKPSVKNANHDNWFLCNGQAISRVDYSDLFALIGTNFGAGDGTTTFNLPDYRGKFLRGLGGDSANDIYTTQAEGLPNITGSIGKGHSSSVSTRLGAFDSDDANGAFYQDRNDSEQDQYYPDYSGWAYAVKLDASRSSAIYGASSHVTPINQAVNYFIKVKEEQ